MGLVWGAEIILDLAQGLAAYPLLATRQRRARMPCWLPIGGAASTNHKSIEHETFSFQEPRWPSQTKTPRERTAGPIQIQPATMKPIATEEPIAAATAARKASLRDLKGTCDWLRRAQILATVHIHIQKAENDGLHSDHVHCPQPSSDRRRYRPGPVHGFSGDLASSSSTRLSNSWDRSTVS